MIVKKVKYSDQSKRKTWQIGDLVDYIRSPHNTNPLEKIAHAGSRNFLSGTHTGQKLEMILLAEESVHSKMPVSHWIFSWKENEQPSRAQVDELVDAFLAHMGLGEHQAVYGLHFNTKNYHVHIAVNRMHPGTLRVVQPFRGFDIEEAHKVVALVERKQGWASEPYTRYVVLENGELARNQAEKPPQPRQGALAVERNTGEKSAQRMAQERGHSIIKNAASWAELHQKLAEQGLRFEKKGSGAIIFVGDIAVKASSVDRGFGMSKLCKRLGDFVPAEITTLPATVAPEPVSSINHEEWRRYQAEYNAIPPTKQTQEGNPRETLRQQQREERERVLPTFAQQGLPMLNIARHFLKLKQQEERKELRQMAQPKHHRGKPHFEAWLRRQGLHEQADRWRYRNRLEKVPPPAQAARRERHTPRPAPQTAAPGSTVSAYYSHYEDIQKHLAVEDLSRVDAMIAVRLRANGHSPQAVTNAIMQCAPTIRQKSEGRNWQRYAERTTDYAFSVAGDVALAKHARQMEQWRKVEGEETAQQEATRFRMR